MYIMSVRNIWNSIYCDDRGFTLCIMFFWILFIDYRCNRMYEMWTKYIHNINWIDRRGCMFM